jgi:exodeoxyribonuclease-5
MVNPDYRLETIHRNAGEIAHFAQHLHQGKPARTFRSAGKVRVLSKADVRNKLLLGADQVIVAFNKTRIELNNHIRQRLGFKGTVGIGERIICLRNHHQRGLYNGQQGTVDRVDHVRSVLDFTTDDTAHREVPFDPGQFAQEKLVSSWTADAPVPFDYAHAITCHKAQGGEWNRVLVFEQLCEHWDHRRWAYTAASRARKVLRWIAA